jgi:hypothetical protein
MKLVYLDMSLFIMGILSLVVARTLWVTNSSTSQIIVTLHLSLSSVVASSHLHLRGHLLEPVRYVGPEVGFMLGMVVTDSGCLEACSSHLCVVHVALVAAAFIYLFFAVVRAA